MRLIKLAAYALLGYVLYELFLGISQEHERQRGGQRSSGSARPSSSQRDLNRALNEDGGRSNLTGPGEGQQVATADATGAFSRHTVGRGVVSR